MSINRRSYTLGRAEIPRRRLGHRVSYNFSVVEIREVQPKSSLDDLSGAIEIEDGPSQTADSEKAQLGVRVVDRETNGLFLSSRPSLLGD